MIWEYDVHAIVMLCKCIEKDKVRKMLCQVTFCYENISSRLKRVRKQLSFLFNMFTSESYTETISAFFTIKNLH